MWGSAFSVERFCFAFVVPLHIHTYMQTPAQLGGHTHYTNLASTLAALPYPSCEFQQAFCERHIFALRVQRLESKLTSYLILAAVFFTSCRNCTEEAQFRHVFLFFNFQTQNYRSRGYWARSAPISRARNQIRGSQEIPSYQGRRLWYVTRVCRVYP